MEKVILKTEDGRKVEADWNADSSEISALTAKKKSPVLTCDLCGSGNFSAYLSVSPANFSTKIKEYDVYRCLDCGHCVMSPFPTRKDVSELYVENNIFSPVYKNPNKKQPLFDVLDPLYRKYGTDCRFIVSTCLKLCPGAKSVLDIGCSTGELLSHFPIERVGIDIDPKAKTEDYIIIDDFLVHDFGRKFDIITMKYTIEHLLDFKPYVEKVKTLLNPGGVFFIITPDIDSPKARRLGAKWNLINDSHGAIGHVRWFNKSSLNRLADIYGFRVLKSGNRGELIDHIPNPIRRLFIALLGKSNGRFIKWYPIRIIYAILVDGLLSEKLSYGENAYAFLT